MNCTHEREYPEYEPTYEDIDLHRFRCTQCGEIFYYSNKSRRHFENGEIFPGIKGLDK